MIQIPASHNIYLKSFFICLEVYSHDIRSFFVVDNLFTWEICHKSTLSNDKFLQRVMILAQSQRYVCILVTWSSGHCNRTTLFYKVPAIWPCFISYSSNPFVHDLYQCKVKMLVYHFFEDLLMESLILNVI